MLGTINTKAQSGYNYREWAFGLEGGGSKAFADMKRQDYGYVASASIYYNYSPYLPIGAEFQIGRLSGGGIEKDIDKHTRFFKNNYKAIILHADLQVGELGDYANSWLIDRLKGLYVGTGAGLIFNNNTVNKFSDIDPTYEFPGKEKSINVLIPIRFGYEFKIFNGYNEPDIMIDIGYRHNFAFGEGLDGYADPPSKFKNNAIDQYAQVTIGIKYTFGTAIAYNKLIRSFR